MAASPLRGIDGVFKVGTTTDKLYDEIAYADSFSINAAVDVSEISKLNATAKEFIRGLGSATLSASGTLIWDSSEQKKLINQFMILSTSSSTTTVATSNLVFMGLLQQGTTVGTTAGAGGLRSDVSIQCQVIPTGFSIEEAASGSPTWSYDGQVTGNVRYVVKSCTDAVEKYDT
jgi:hypothetical protein